MKTPESRRKWLRISLKVLFWILAGVFTLIITGVLLLQLPAVQNYAAQKAVTYLKGKLKTEVRLASINIGFPKTINLKGLYIEDLKGDTLLYAAEVNAGIDMLGIITRNTVNVRSIDLEGVYGHVYRLYPDTTFNYSFIVSAFAAQDTSSVVSDTSAAMIIKLNTISFEDVRLKYRDTISGVNAAVNLGQFDTEFRDFDLEKMVFKVEGINLLNSSVTYIETTPLKKSADTSESVMPDLGFGTFSLEKFSADYVSKVSGIALAVDVGDLKVSTDKMDLVNQKFTVSSLQLNNSNISFSQAKPQHLDTIVAEVIKEQGIEKEIAQPEWEFTLKNLQLNNNQLSYNNLDSANKSTGIDFNHLLFSQFNLNLNNIYATPGKITADLDRLAFLEKSGFRLNDFRTRISYDTTNITLADLLITTPNSRIGDHLEASFTSITSIVDSLEQLRLNVNLNNTLIGVADILHIMPEISENESFKLNGSDKISLRGSITGPLNNIDIAGLVIDNGKNTRLAVSGEVRNILEPEDLFAMLNVTELRTTRNDIYTYAGTGLIPENISIPNNISISGQFNGYLRNFTSKMNVTTTFGNVRANVKMNPSLGNTEVPYKINVDVSNLDLGKILQQPDTLGPVSLTFYAEGVGMDPDSLNAMVRAKVSEAFYSGYTYKDLNLEGFIVNRSFHGEVWMKDNNIDFNYTGYVNLNPDSLAFIFDLNLNGVDLQALNLSEGDFKISGSVSSDLAKRYGPNPLGDVKIYDVKFIRNDFTCPLDTIRLESTYNYDSSFITISSPFLNASFKGDIILQELAATMTNHFNGYFEFAEPDSIITTRRLRDQDFNYSISMDDPNRICNDLLPGLKDYNPLVIQGNFNSREKIFNLEAGIPLINYNDITIDSLYFEVNTDPNNLKYNFTVAELSNPMLALQHFDFDGTINDNKITYHLNAAKSDSFNVLRTSGAFAKDNENYLLIVDEPLILNNTAWNIDPDNKITFSEKGLEAQRVILKGGNQLVSMITQPGDNIPLKVAFENFELSNASLIIEKDKELVRGRLNGHFILFKVNGVSAFTSDLSIDSLKFQSIPIGNLILMADNSDQPKTFDLGMRLSGNGNDMVLNGKYTARDSTSYLNMAVDISRLNLSAIEPFTFGQVSRMSGFLNGDIDIKGTIEKPEIMGELNLNDVAFNAPYANTYLKVNNNRMTLENQRLVVDNLTLVDTLQNTAVLNGYADFSDISDLKFDFSLKTEDFLAMNSNRSNGDMPLYGKLLIDSDIQLGGAVSSPVIRMRVQLNNGTNITYVMPESQYTLNQSEGIVVFTDSIAANSIMVKDTIPETRSSAQGISLNASIVFEPEAVLKMLVDPVAGDSMYVSGEGTLNFSMDPGGQMDLTGTYDISSGGYNLTINGLIKRQFKLSDESTITWTGDIMDAMVNLTAVYTVKTSPLLLLEGQLEGAEETERNKFRNNLTFFVYLNMTGNLLKPQISFDIEQPEDEKGYMNGAVNAKLNELKTDESQLNKQVFALLTLNRFLGQDPFETGNAPLTVESATRASASKILTQQFSALSEKYIKGVDLDVGLNSYEDYSTGNQQGRTQLQLGVTKEFLNDRVSVQVGGNVELEGERTRENEISNIAGNVNVEYKITPNGRYKLRAFRRIEYENPIEAELINTGIGITYSREFRRFKNLLESDKKRKERLSRLAEEPDNQKNNEGNEAN